MPKSAISSSNKPAIKRVRPAEALTRAANTARCRRTWVTPEILYIDRFLTTSECSRIVKELEFAFWRPSLTYQKQGDGSYRNLLSPLRVSDTAHVEWFSDELKEMLVRIDQRLRLEFGVDPAYLEDWQATAYAPGGKFDYHLDAGYWDEHYAGDRILTFLLYLNTPRRGGATHFRALDETVQAKAGRLLVWNNLFPSGGSDARMIHSGTPVVEGRKTTLVSWQRQKKYRIAK